MKQFTSASMAGAAIIGGVVGASLALILAPRTGEETRESMQHNFDELRHATKAKAQRLSPVLSAWEEEV